MKLFVERYRTLLLILLAILLFANFYHSKLIYDTVLVSPPLLKQFHADFLQSWVQWSVFRSIVIRGGGLTLLSFGNVLLSACILYVYFKGKKAVLRIGIGLLAFYWLGFIMLCLCTYFAGWKSLFIVGREALLFLPSPLVEASLIPILQLYDREVTQQQQNKPTA